MKPLMKKLKQVDEVQREVAESHSQPELRQEAEERIPAQVTGAHAAAAEQYSEPWSIVRTGSFQEQLVARAHACEDKKFPQSHSVFEG